MASLARASHFSSRRNCSSVSVAKNLVLLRAGWPSGFNKPAVTSLGISCGSKPRNHAVWVALSRAGTTFQLRNSVCWAVMFIHGWPPRARAGKIVFGFDSRNSFVRRRPLKQLPPGLALGSWSDQVFPQSHFDGGLILETVPHARTSRRLFHQALSRACWHR